MVHLARAVGLLHSNVRRDEGNAMHEIDNIMGRATRCLLPLLTKRLDAGRAITEDSVRYTLFAALLSTGIEPHQIDLEVEYPRVAGTRSRRLDALVYAPSAVPLAAI